MNVIVKLEIIVLMNGLCNLNNVVYLGIIYPKENKDKKSYQNFLHEMEN